MAASIQKQCISSSDSDSDSTIVTNSECSHYIETDQWEFEETIGDKISDGNTFRRIMEPYHFEPYANYSDEDGDNGGVGQDENACHMFTTEW